MRKRGETVGIVDFGSREIRVLIARQDSDGMIQVLGHGSEPSRACISQGVIQDLNAAQVALKKAVASAEKEAQVNLTSLFCGVNGKNVDTFIREGKVKIEQQVVDNALMNAALDIASHDILAPGKRVTSSVTAQEWYVDDLRVMDPVGIRGQVLKTRVHFALIGGFVVAALEVGLLVDRLRPGLEGVVHQLPQGVEVGQRRIRDDHAGRSEGAILGGRFGHATTLAATRVGGHARSGGIGAP